MPVQIQHGIRVAEHQAQKYFRHNPPAHRAQLASVVAGPVDPVLEGADLAVRLRRSRAEHITRLRTELTRDLPLLYVPYLFTRAHGMRTTRTLAEAVGAELGY